MDYASTTPVDPEVIEKMLPYFSTHFGNASSIHSYGLEANDANEDSRESIANLLNSDSSEIIFTAGGTESDNYAIKGTAYRNWDIRKKKGPHIITTPVEHPAVLETCKYLEKQGFEVHYLSVDKYGLIDIEELNSVIGKNTLIVSVIYANNEIGTIAPIDEIGKISRENNVLFHTDAVQAVGKLPVDVKKSNIDLLSLSSHKIYGPKGVGALYIKEGVKLEPLIHGGGHEKGLRSSTYNTPGIVGLGKACDIARRRISEDMNQLKKLRDYLIKNVLNIEQSYLNGHPTKRLVNNSHFRFAAIEGESLNLMLDDKGIATATGSACSSKKLNPSHVLLAIGLSPEEAHGSLRLSIGRQTTKDDVIYVSNELSPIVDKLRNMSPLWNR